MQNKTIKKWVKCANNSQAPLPSICEILEDEGLKAAAAVVAEMAVRLAPSTV